MGFSCLLLLWEEGVGLGCMSFDMMQDACYAWRSRSGPCSLAVRGCWKKDGFQERKQQIGKQALLCFRSPEEAVVWNRKQAEERTGFPVLWDAVALSWDTVQCFPALFTLPLPPVKSLGDLQYSGLQISLG